MLKCYNSCKNKKNIEIIAKKNTTKNKRIYICLIILKNQ